MYACVCRGVTVADIRRAGAAGITAAESLIAALRLDDDPGCCGRCRQNIDQFVELARGNAARESDPVAGDLIPLTVLGAA